MDLLSTRLTQLIQNLSRRVQGIVNTFKRAYARTGIWWVVFTISMAVLAVNFIILAVFLYISI